MTSLFYIRMHLVNFNVFSCFVVFFSFVFVFAFCCYCCCFFISFFFIASDSRHPASSTHRYLSALLFQFFGEFKLL